MDHKPHLFVLNDFSFKSNCFIIFVLKVCIQFLKMLFSTLLTTLYLLKGMKGTGFWHKLLNCLFRGYNESPVGRCHRVDAVHVCQRLRLIHHHRLGSFLAHGLPKRRRRHKDGYRTLSGGHSCSFHGQVSQQLITFWNWMKF